MCGRYAAFLPADALAALFRIAGAMPGWTPRQTVRPTETAPVVRLHPETRERRPDLLRWGLVPHWTSDPKKARQPINARSESLASTPMFRDAYARRRCLVPATAYYEWQTVSGGKRPWTIARADGAPMVFAGLWEGWRGPDGTVIRSYAIVTTSACPTLRPLHERMPVVLEPADWPVWLGETDGDLPRLTQPSIVAFTLSEGPRGGGSLPELDLLDP